jgi:hypothetical protein
MDSRSVRLTGGAKRRHKSTVRKTSKKMSKKSSRKSMKGGRRSHKRASKRSSKRSSKRKTSKRTKKSMKAGGGPKNVLPIVSPDAFNGVARIFDDDNIAMIKLYAGESKDKKVNDFGANWDQIWKDFSRPINKQTLPRYQVSKAVGDFLNDIKGKSILKSKGKNDAWDLL